MRGLRNLMLVVNILALVFVLTGTAKAQVPKNDMTTFFDSEIPQIKIQVNATAQTLPTKNMTVIVSLETQANVGVEYFNLEVSGFLNGTIKLSMANITDDNFRINSTSKEYNSTFPVPEWVWGVTYGEIKLTYNVTALGMVSTFPNVINGFPMTQVENTYLEGLKTQNTMLQDQIKSWNDSFQRLTTLYQNLSSTLEQLNQTYVQLYQNYTSVKGSLGDLDNTRRVMTVLAVTTIIFFVTTIYLAVRRPKEPW
jgi:hypothetical protein